MLLLTLPVEPGRTDCEHKLFLSKRCWEEIRPAHVEPLRPKAVISVPGEDDQPRPLKNGHQSAQHVFPISIRQLAFRKNHRYLVFAQMDQSISVSTRRVEFPVRLFEIILEKRELFERGTDGQAAQLTRAFKCPIAQAVGEGFGGRHNVARE